jgi:hypothetical protein
MSDTQATFTHFQAMATLCDAMAAYLAAVEPAGPLPDDTPIMSTINVHGGPSIIITAGMIRAAGGAV